MIKNLKILSILNEILKKQKIVKYVSKKAENLEWKVFRKTRYKMFLNEN